MPRYDKGVNGELKKLTKKLQLTNNNVFNNKAQADITQQSNEDIMCELDVLDRLAEIETALIELEEMIEGE